MQKLRQKKKNQCKKRNIEVANTNGRVVNFQTILIQDHCTHLSCFPQKPKQLTASKPLLPQQTVQTDQDNQDIDTEKNPYRYLCLPSSSVPTENPSLKQEH